MVEPAPHLAPQWAAVASVLVAAMGTGCLIVLGRMAWLLARGQPVVPFSFRRPVPWGAGELGAVLLLYIGGSIAMVQAAGLWLGEEAFRAPAQADDAPPIHPAVRLLQEDGGPVTFLIAALMAVVVAPIAEEFLFRLLLQGYLEKLEGRLRHALRKKSWWRASPTLRRWFHLREGLLPILTTSLMFALMHFRSSEPVARPAVILVLLIGNMVVSLAVVLAGVAVIRLNTEARLADLGLVPTWFWSDVRLGLLAFLAIGPPVYLVQILATRLLPETVAADPIALFLLAAGLGLLYHRTHRIVPSIVVHMALNGTTLLMLWLTLPG